MTSFALAIDGASKGNPGAAGIGVVLYDEHGEIVREISEYIGETTNNAAEYTALIRGLKEALTLGATSIRISTDSELLARQIAGVYRVKSPHLATLYMEAKSLLARIGDAKIRHVPREENSRADKLASSAANRKNNADELSGSTVPAPARTASHKQAERSRRPGPKPPQPTEPEQLNLLWDNGKTK